MKVILLRDVAKLGKRFSVVEVPDGYALNKLVPQGLAQPATAENLKRVSSNSAAKAKTEDSALAEFTKSVQSLKGKPLIIAVEANAQEHLFKAIKASDIATAAAALGHAIPVDSIIIADPIKALGTYTIAVKMGDVKDVLVIEIINK